MPWASALLLDIGRVIGAHTFLVLAGTGMFVVALLLAWSRPATRAWLGARVRQLPGFGPRIRVYEMARLYRTLAMLLRGGTPIVPALGLASSMLSVVMRAQLARSAKQISQGAPLSRAFESNGLTTAVGNRMLGVGERGGGMADMLERIADYHDEETARWVDWVSRLFEPIMMAVLGLVIGGIVILLYMPIFDLAGSVQ
jgi:general secretion pathway protein F